MFRMIAEKYRSILARNRVTLKILPSNGSLENLQRLSDRSSAVDLGFIQGGVSAGVINGASKHGSTAGTGH
jgi:TRAP-type uncharacterized transport system substrate-binding protein